MDLNEIAVFLQVVELGSFSAAAKKLAMPNSTVSMKVSALEKRLGTLLIQRTTRRLHVTAEGQRYFERCRVGLGAIQSAEDEVGSIRGEPHGSLKVTAPVELGAIVLPTILSRYTTKYKRVSVEVVLTDRRVDLTSEGIDLAIRAGDLQDSTLMARKFGEVCFALFAAPSYLAARPSVSHPKDLTVHDCLHFSELGSRQWTLSNSKSKLTVPAKGQMASNDLNLIKLLAVQGAGIALLPTFFCASEIKTKGLIRILPEWRTVLRPIHLVYPKQKFNRPKLTAFIDISLQTFKAVLL